MLAVDKDALLCDLAETYQVMDWRALPVKTVAVLASGLSPDSRIKRKLAGETVSGQEIMMAAMVDRLSFLAWAKTKDAQKGRGRPKSLVEMLRNPVGKSSQRVETYDTPEAFERARNKALKGR